MGSKHLTTNIKKDRFQGKNPQNRSKLAGVAGFEPTNDGVRVRCLTAWRHPNMKLSFQTRFSIADKKHKLFPKTKESQFVLPALFYQTFPFFASVFICLF